MFCQFCGTNLGKKKDCDKCVDKKKARDFSPRLAKDYTDKQKVEAFDKLHASMLDTFEKKKAGDLHDDDMSDIRHYVWEDAMKLTLGPNIFEIWNKL